MRRYLIIALFVVSCTNETTKEKCNPVGNWKLTIETANGDCFESGQAETFELKVTKADVKDLDGHCSGDDFMPLEYPETEEDFGIQGLLEFQVTFDGDKLTGRGRLDAELIASGESVDTCTQNYSITGTK
jgi:hypothetical protein